MLAHFEDGKNVGNGSGFAVTDDGVLATNSHVVRGGQALTAVAKNGDRFDVLGILADDPEHDLALVRIAPTSGTRASTTALPLAPADSLAVGQDVFVIGASQGLDQSFSVGLIAAIRDALPEGYSDPRGAKLGPFVQHTATAAPGSSGSPVLDAQGRVVAVHHSGIAGTGIHFGAHVRLLADLMAATDFAATPVPLGPKVGRNLAISAAVFAVPFLAWLLFKLQARRQKAKRKRPLDVN